MPMDNKVIFINGFSRDKTMEIMRAVKNVLKNPQQVAFCMGTESNMHWQVKDLIEQVSEEHRRMTGQK